MYCRATVICEKVRLDLNGTMTFVGVHSERLFAPKGTGPMQVPRLQFVTIIGGLRGASRIRYRHQLRAASEPETADLPFCDETHDPAADEHNFVFGDGAIMFPGEGIYEYVTEVEANNQRESFRYRFEIVREKS